MNKIKKIQNFTCFILRVLFWFNKNVRCIVIDKYLYKKAITYKKVNHYIKYDCTNIPVFIISYNRLDYVKQMVNWLGKYGFHNIHIVDNKSTYKPLLKYLDNIKNVNVG